MGKKSKGGNEPKEKKNPNDKGEPSGSQQGASGSNQSGNKKKEQPLTSSGNQKEQSKTGQQQNQYRGGGGDQQPQGARGQQAPKQQPQGAWSQQAPKQEPQGAWSQQAPKQQPQGAWSEQAPKQQPQGAWSQQAPKQQPQGAWSQPAHKPPPQRTDGQQGQQGQQEQQRYRGQQKQGYQGQERGYQGHGRGQQGQERGYEGQGRGQQGQERGYQGQGRGYEGQARGQQGQERGYQGQGRGYEGQARGQQGQERGYQGQGREQQGQERGYHGQGRGQQGQDRGHQRPERRYQDQQDRRGPSQQDQQQQAVVPLLPLNPNSPLRGKLGNSFTLETNYLTLDLDKMPDVAYHYDVKIDPDRPKKFLRSAFYAYVEKVFPDYTLAYDGKANAYSTRLLPEEILNANQEVEVKVSEEDRHLTFKISVKATDDVEIDLKSLKKYHSERIFDKPMRALQCIEVVLSSPCHEKGVRAGRSFFTQPSERLDLGDGFELWFGLFQAAMLCNQPLLNVDVSNKSFPSEINLVQFYDRSGRPNCLDDLLKGLRVNYTPPPCFKATPKGFKFLAVKGASSQMRFKTDDGQEQSVAEYYQSKGYTLKRPELPCLHVGSSVKNIYIPLELLNVPTGQAIMRKDTDNQVRQMIRFAATSTDERKQKIMRLLQFFQYNIHPTVQRFGLSVGSQFITVNARLLSSPQIQYANGKNISISRPGEWMMENVGFLKCDRQQIAHQWAIINISRKQEINALFLKENFVSLVTSLAGKLGMSLAPNCSEIIEPPAPPRSGGSRYKVESIRIKSDLEKMKKKKYSIVFVILPYGNDSYAFVKQDAELSCGIVTQCIKGDTIRSESRMGLKTINAMTVKNILLKVNAKLNGTNHRIAPNNEISMMQKSKVMFVGADVSHPSPLQKNLPSIVGVVASHDLYGTQYNMQYRLQSPGKEQIEDMKDIFTQHLNVYKAMTKALPDHIIYYRDGVSDGQFQQIEKTELLAMRAACQAMKCKAKFTCIIVVKRHHTRFFPKSRDGEGKFNNVKAGTVVDHVIVHPNEVQFFMVSHKAIQGTSKPTRYNVIVDDAKIGIDDLQAMTYNLCHLFPRCNRSVSYPAPAYLAHLVGLRGRAYIEGPNLNLENLKTEYSKRRVSDEVMKLNPMFFV